MIPAPRILWTFQVGSASSAARDTCRRTVGCFGRPSLHPLSCSARSFYTRDRVPDGICNRRGDSRSSHGCTLSGEHAFAHGASRINGRNERGAAERPWRESRVRRRAMGEPSDRTRLFKPHRRASGSEWQQEEEEEPGTPSRLELTSIFGAVRAPAELTGEYVPWLGPTWTFDGGK